MKFVDSVKIQLFDKIKTLQNPSKDLKCLANQIKSHFTELEHFVLVDSDEIQTNEFSI